MGDTKNIGFVYTSERREDRQPFQAILTKETKAALEDLDCVGSWGQLRRLCKRQAERREKGLRW